jgi:hypothetical protein
MDHRDQLLAICIELASLPGISLWELLEPEEIEHWLGFLDGDFLYSQPWTLTLAIQKPSEVLKRLVHLYHEPDQLANALGDLGQCGWSWWMVSQREFESMNASDKYAIRAALDLRAAKMSRLLGQLTSEALKMTLIHRLCEEGLPLQISLPSQARLLKSMGLDLPWGRSPMGPDEISQAILQSGPEGTVGLMMDRVRRGDSSGAEVPKPIGHYSLPGIQEGHALAPMGRINQWGKLHRSWFDRGKSSFVCDTHLARSIPVLCRHYAPLLTLFHLMPRKRVHA